MIAAGGPGGGPGQGSQQEPMAVASLVAGIASVPLFACCGLLSLGVSIVGVVLGIASLSRLKSEPLRYTGKPLAIAGLAINAIIVIVTLLLMVFMFGIMGIGALSGP